MELLILPPTRITERSLSQMGRNGRTALKSWKRSFIFRERSRDRNLFTACDLDSPIDFALGSLGRGTINLPCDWTRNDEPLFVLQLIGKLGQRVILQNFLRMSSEDVIEVCRVVMWTLVCAAVEVDPVPPQSKGSG